MEFVFVFVFSNRLENTKLVIVFDQKFELVLEFDKKTKRLKVWTGEFDSGYGALVVQ